MPAGVAVASDEACRGVPGPTTDRPGVPRRGGAGGEGAGAATERRRRGAGCFPARAARAAGEGSRCDAEAWRDDEENAPRVARPIGRVNVDDSVAAIPHTHRIAQGVGMDLEVPH